MVRHRTLNPFKSVQQDTLPDRKQSGTSGTKENACSLATHPFGSRPRRNTFLK
jgi:hypothetical protein